MAQSYYSNGSHSPPYNDILKGTPDNPESPSSEVATWLPAFYQRRGSMVRDWHGNEMFCQFPPGETPPILDDEEIRVMYSEV